MSRERLLAAALREGLLVASPPSADGTTRFVPGAGGAPDAGALVATAYDAGGSVLEARLAALSAEPPGRTSARRPLPDAPALLAWLREAMPDLATDGSWTRLAEEIADSEANETLARRHRRAVTSALLEDAKREAHASLWSWLRARASQLDVPLWLEQYSAVGHPLHLAPKNRAGLEAAEVRAYFPEFQPVFPVTWGALARDAAQCECHPSLTSLTSWIAARLPASWASWRAWQREAGRDPADWVPLPLHPLQRERILPGILDAGLEASGFDLEGPTTPCAPTLSVRTVVPQTGGLAPHLKLALGVRLTSMRRNLSPRSCAMGPRISALLQEVLRRDAELRAGVDVVPELAGIWLGGADPVRGGPLRDLAAIVRENPSRCVGAGEIPIPASALPLTASISERPFLLELGGGGKEGGGLEAFRAYAKLLLRPVLRLFLRYGILVEAHPQNSFLVVDARGRPQRLLLRDFGGIRIHEPTLRARGLDLDVHPDRLTVTDTWGVARRRLIHAVYQWHLGHLVTALSRYDGADPGRLWLQVREVTTRILDEHRGAVPAARWRDERALLLEADWPAKSSLRMRLADTQDEIHVPSPNLLKRAR